jgi:hypothetical protein
MFWLFFYYLIRMGNYPESKIFQKIVAKKIIMGVLTLKRLKRGLAFVRKEAEHHDSRFHGESISCTRARV